MDLCAIVTGTYLGWVLLAALIRKQVRLHYRIVQDVIVLILLSFVLTFLCYEVTASVVLAALAVIMYHDLPSPWITLDESMAVVVTGCDRGLGQALALQLDKLGVTVFAGCLFMGGEGERQLAEAASSRLTTVQMDVTDPEQVLQAAQTVGNKLNGKRLHGVVNNAGVLFTANMEVMSMDDIRKQLEVNCLGTIHVYRAFMPLLRQPRSQSTTARIVNVSSNMGIAPVSQGGPYCASKAAVAILSETWRYELKPMNIHVSTIIPSGFKTGILGYDKEAAAERWWDQASEEIKEYFGRDCFNPKNKKEDVEKYLDLDFSKVTSCMCDALFARIPKPFYYKGFLARSLSFSYLHLPSFLWDRVMPLLGDYYHFPVRALKASKTD